MNFHNLALTPPAILMSPSHASSPPWSRRIKSKEVGKEHLLIRNTPNSNIDIETFDLGQFLPLPFFLVRVQVAKELLDGPLSLLHLILHSGISANLADNSQLSCLH